MNWESWLSQARLQPWQLLLEGPASGEVNMARDEELLETCQEPTLRLYSWSEPTVSLGYSQAPVKTSLPVVRRPSGGRGLLHHQEITYAVVLPRAAGLSVAQAFCGLAGAVREALTALGVPVSCAQALNSNRSLGCMASTRPGELVTPLGKLVGCAQVKRGERLLHHGVIPLRVDQELLEEVFPGHPPGHGLEDLGCSLTAGHLAGALAGALGVRLTGL